MVRRASARLTYARSGEGRAERRTAWAQQRAESLWHGVEVGRIATARLSKPELSTAKASEG